MKNLQNKINELIALHLSALKDLKEINEKNFHLKLESAQKHQAKALLLKTKLLEDYDNRILQKFEFELLALAKELKKLYDNILAEKHSQLFIAAEELKNVQNKKNIMAYER